MKLPRALGGYLGAQAISLTGTRVSMVAIPWFVLTTTGSATRTGIAAFAEMGPLVLCQALSGPLTDRLGARRIAVWCNLLSVLVVGAVPVLHLVGRLSWPVLLVLVALAGSLRGPSEAATHALIPAVAENSGGMSLERVTGLAGAVERTASMAGAAIAGAVVAVAGGANALALDAASFLVSAVVLVAAVPGAAPAVGTTDTPQGLGYLDELRDGWAFMRRDVVLMGIGVMVAITNLLDQAYSAVLLPVWAHASGNGVGAVGLVGAVTGGAAILGSVVAATYAERLPRFRTYLVAFLVAGAPRFVVLAVGAPIWGVVATCLVAGFGAGFLNPILGAVLFERIPARLPGRVSAMNIAMSWSLIPLGGLVGGFAVAGIGLSPALLVVGAAYFVTTMLPAVQPRWRELDTRRGAGAESKSACVEPAPSGTMTR